MEKNIFYMTFGVCVPWELTSYEFETYAQAVAFCDDMDIDTDNIQMMLYVKKNRFSRRFTPLF